MRSSGASARFSRRSATVPFVFNLGHGIVPETPPENVAKLVELVRVRSAELGPMLWLKAFHIMAVIAWLAGLFYLPRLFVYHAGAAPGSELSETLKVMEQRLLRIIMGPGECGRLADGAASGLDAGSLRRGLVHRAKWFWSPG